MSFYSTATVPRSSHPDKLCDAIVGALVAAIKAHDAGGQARLHAAATINSVMVWGEMKSVVVPDVLGIVRTQIAEAGYELPALRFTPLVAIDNSTTMQGALVADATRSILQVAYGFASNETPSFLPLALVVARALGERLDALCAAGMFPYVRPGGVVQVRAGLATGKMQVQEVVMRIPHNHTVSHEQVRQDMYLGVIEPTLYDYGQDIRESATQVNPEGPWHDGGPAIIAGTSGLWADADSYGNGAPFAHALHGCDLMAWPRIATYGVRYIAKNVVAAGLAKRVQVAAQLTPEAKGGKLSFETFGTATVKTKVIEDFAARLLDFRQSALVQRFNLEPHRYISIARHGHFHSSDLPWEKIARAEDFV